MVTPLVRPFSESYSCPSSIGDQVLLPVCLQIGILSSSVSLGIMPPALALAPVPLVREVLDGGVPSSAVLTPAAVAPLVAPQVSEVELSTLP